MTKKRRPDYEQRLGTVRRHFLSPKDIAKRLKKKPEKKQRGTCADTI